MPDDAASIEKLLTQPSGRAVVAMVTQILREGGDVEWMLREALTRMASAIKAERGLIFLLQEGESLQAVLNLPDRPIRLDADDYSSNILRRAITDGKPVLIHDVQKDNWAAGFESVQMLGMTSILAVPILSNDKVLGAVYLDSRRKGVRFTEADRDLLMAFTSLIARPVERGAELRRRAEEIKKLEDIVKAGLAELNRRNDFRGILGQSDVMRRVFDTVERVAASPYPVIVMGETGTGKELVAKALHFASPRNAKPFLPVNCGAVSETLLESQLFGHAKGAFTGADQAKIGLFQAADGGTLFLDEIEEMSDAMQKKLLRVLEESRVMPVGSTVAVKIDVRIVAATNREMKALLEEGRFREDLFYRLGTFLIRMPPLRDRVEDIPLLIEHFLNAIALETQQDRPRITPEAMALLMRHPWPGNVRELRNELRKMSVLAGGTVRPDDLPVHIRETTGSLGKGSLRTRLHDMDRKLIIDSLQRTQWNLSKAARELGINRNTLKTRIRRHGIKKAGAG